MQKRWWTLLLIVAVAASPAWNAVAQEEETYEEEAEAEVEVLTLAPGEWQPVLEHDAQLFPSLIISTAAIRYTTEEGEEPDPTVLGDTQGLLGVIIGSPKAGARVRVEVRSDPIMLPSVFEGVLPEKDVTYYIFPKINYKFDALHKVRQQTPLSVSFDVSIDGKPQPQRVETAVLRSINDCPLVSLDPATGEPFDLSWMFAAYVNENHPQIDEILGEALDTRIVDSFTGYQSGDPEQVYLQVFAIWNVLQRRGFKYSNITATPGASQYVFSQHVRFMDEALKTSQANCVDGSALIASILRKLDIGVHLILVPGHCFLAFDLDPEGNEVVGLETTMMGADHLGDYDEIEEIDEDEAEELKNDASFQTFSAAIDAGTQAILDNADKFKDESETEYLSIAIEPAREMGIMPIGRSE